MPTIAEALQIAIQHQQAGRFSDAEQIYRQILAVEPHHADALHLLGVIAHQTGKQDEAIATISQAIELKVKEAASQDQLGNALIAQGKLAEATACHRRAAELKPSVADALNNLGLAFHAMGKLTDAVIHFRRALELQPDDAETYSNLGNALKDQGQLDEAAACHQRAVALQPSFAEAYNNLGNVLKLAGKLDEAVATYLQAIQVKPDYVNALNNLGVAYNDQGKFSEAAGVYRRGLALNPSNAEAHFNLALLNLLTGNYLPGWDEYEWRWRTESLQKYFPNYPQPLWNGESLAGKTILVHAEQGLGDTLQFIRYAPLLKQLGAKVVFACPPALIPLLSRCPAIDTLIPEHTPPPACDYFVPLLSLPRRFKTDLTNLPASIPYLSADPRLIERWRARLAEYAGFRIGINWHGGESNRYWRIRNLPLALFAQIAAKPGLQLFSLQKGPLSTSELNLLRQLKIAHFTDELDTHSGPFMDTAAIMKNLDLVITSDTSIAHLAGALGVPVWVALPFMPDWRWLLDREDCPWYPTMRLFRQSKRDAWEEVFERMLLSLP